MRAGTVVDPATGSLAVLLVSVATIAIGSVGLRLSRTTSDFYVASRAVSAPWNASAIGGEYLSAASFLGVAGLVLAGGVDMLWFPLGYTTGYLVLLVLVAAPLRRSGAYTLPDFAQSRLVSWEVRLVSSVLVSAARLDVTTDPRGKAPRCFRFTPERISVSLSGPALSTRWRK